MTTINELREVLEHRAGTPDPAGMIEAAQARAVVVRRRRRFTAATVVAGLVVVAVMVPVAVGRLRTPDPLPASPAPYRGPGQATVDVQPAPGFFVSTRRTDVGRQLLTVRNRDAGSGDSGGTVTVFDPGTPRRRSLESAERITIGGRPAFLQPAPGIRSASPSAQGEPETETRTTISWADRSGAWIEVSGARSRPALQRLAESVRLGPPRPVVSPVRFGWLPDGLRLSRVAATDDPAAPPGFAFTATVGIAAPPGRGSVNGLNMLAVTTTVQKTTTGSWKQLVGTPGQPGVLGPEPRWRTIGGQRAWYQPRGSKGPADWTTNLLIETGKCGVRITLGVPGLISYDELVRMVEEMTFADCTDPATWTPALK